MSTIFDFETEVSRDGTGNMKGLLAQDHPADRVMLYGAELDYPTAPCVRTALEAFVRNGSYGFTLETEKYRTRICWWMQRMRHSVVDPEWIVPTMGTVFALCTAVRALTEEGDGVIIQTPSYFRFDSAVKRNGRRLVPNRLQEVHGIYTVDYDDLERKMAEPRNRMMIFVNPHNPTGKVFPETDMKRIAALAAKHHVTVFCDEIFAETAQPDHETRTYAVVDPRSITCFSLGKSFGFTGVSQANVLIPDPALRQRYTVQRDRDHYGSIDPFFYQALMAAYTEEGAEWIRAMNQYNRENVRLMQDRFHNRMPLLRISPWEGTYIVWIDCRALGLTDPALQQFMENAGIIADPGAEYGDAGSGFYRWNVATPRRNIEEALDRLEEAYHAGSEKKEGMESA